MKIQVFNVSYLKSVFVKQTINANLKNLFHKMFISMKFEQKWKLLFLIPYMIVSTPTARI